MPMCPHCREQHGAERTLTFDGYGINSCGMYRSRVATLEKDFRDGDLGYQMAAGPSLHQALKLMMMTVHTVRQARNRPELLTEDQVKLAWNMLDATMNIAAEAYSQAVPWTCPSCNRTLTGPDKGICDPCKAQETADLNHEGD